MYFSSLPSHPSPFPSSPSTSPSLLISPPSPRYVIRRILRRGIRFCTEKLGAGPGVFGYLVHTVVEILVGTHTIVEIRTPESILKAGIIGG